MTLQIGVYQDRKTTNDDYGMGTRMLADWTLDARGGVFTTDEYGFGSCSMMVEMDSDTAQLWKNSPGAPRLVISDGPTIAWEGQLEQIKTTDGGINVTALGMFREYAKISPIRDLWSTTKYDDWRIIDGNERAGRNLGKYQVDQNERLYASPTGDTTYFINVDMATFILKVPHGSGLFITKFTFTYDILLTAAFTVEIYSETTADAFPVLEWSLAATGAQQTGTVTLTLASSKQQILINIMPDTSTTYPAFDPGTFYASFTGLRVWATTGSTVLASDAVRSLVERVGGGSSVSTTGIQSSVMDLQDLVFEDLMPLACIDILRGLASEVGRWAFEVWENRRAFFYPAIRTDMPVAYVDEAILHHERDIDRLATFASVVFNDKREFHGLGRTTTVSNTFPKATKVRNRHIVQRGILHKADTTNVLQAESEGVILVTDQLSIIEAGSIVFTEAFDKYGAPIDVWRIRKGWRLVPRRDRIINYHEGENSIIVGRTSYNVDTGVMTAEPAGGSDTMEAVIAKQIPRLPGPK